MVPPAAGPVTSRSAVASVHESAVGAPVGEREPEAIGPFVGREHELDELADLLDATPAPLAPLDLLMLDGYLVGVLVQPRLVPIDEWLPPVFDFEGPDRIKSARNSQCVYTRVGSPGIAAAPGGARRVGPARARCLGQRGVRTGRAWTTTAGRCRACTTRR